MLLGRNGNNIPKLVTPRPCLSLPSKEKMSWPCVRRQRRDRKGFPKQRRHLETGSPSRPLHAIGTILFR